MSELHFRLASLEWHARARVRLMSPEERSAALKAAWFHDITSGFTQKTIDQVRGELYLTVFGGNP